MSRLARCGSCAASTLACGTAGAVTAIGVANMSHGSSTIALKSSPGCVAHAVLRSGKSWLPRLLLIGGKPVQARLLHRLLTPSGIPRLTALTLTSSSHISTRMRRTNGRRERGGSRRKRGGGRSCGRPKWIVHGVGSAMARRPHPHQAVHRPRLKLGPSSSPTATSGYT